MSAAALPTSPTDAVLAAGSFQSADAAYTVAVRTLCELVAKAGDLDTRFTPSPSALEGMAGHQTVGARRHANYRREVTLQGRYRNLRVRGRADGFDPDLAQIEEIKTYRGDLGRQPNNHRQLHWAQARVYGWLLCETLGLETIRVALVYFEIGSQEETVFVETYDAATLRHTFETLCERFLCWAGHEQAHRVARDAALQQLSFPHGTFRDGQRALAETAYRSAVRARHALVQAPTGIGKTLGTLFPMLKAMPGQSLDKVFFLAAKASGRQVALDALSTLRARPPASSIEARHGEHARNAAEPSQTSARSAAAAEPLPLPLRVLELVAREKSCEFPGRACHGDACPLARGFYDKLPAARAAAFAIDASDDGMRPGHAPTLDRASVRDIALAHEVCPYYLSQALVPWSDVVVGDYNYLFDSSASLFAQIVLNEWRVCALVDEAHNLVDRARGMYTASLDERDIARLRQDAPTAVKPALDALQRRWRALRRDRADDYTQLDKPPSAFVDALQQLTTVIADVLAERPTEFGSALQRFYFDALHFTRLAESFGEHSLCDLNLAVEARLAKPRAVLTIRNVVPAPFLRPRFAALRSATLFSATLAPSHYFVDLLGLPADTVTVDVPSPFEAQQLDVRLIGDVSTRYARRDASISPIAELIAKQLDAEPGNYLAFFSSYAYLDQVRQRLAATRPDLTVVSQSPGMDEAAQRAFLARFAADGRTIGFAVLGGSFGEGIDLPGRRLIGAFVATLGLPQYNAVNEAMRERNEAVFGDGYAYTYLYPGLQKVVQAAGRVIRTREDVGTVYLIDERFCETRVRRLLPEWWRPTVRSARTRSEAGLTRGVSDPG
ncbi:ATP-dependent DNA helicase [Chitinasiproducens palmae]|uniref:DNA excision repair protein ERCC-2 n=1 Tax=Chitinasiproducens palmae TaxID=1770053 RepID=A0A1H2PQS1_9BURK|nr:ATP-dependent DNA helicase [Chitinasiproducens palmae]SDV49157.1 DNA excision repair protein ERCC-2 [Chitinasiproducens palmae]